MKKHIAPTLWHHLCWLICAASIAPLYAYSAAPAPHKHSMNAPTSTTDDTQTNPITVRELAPDGQNLTPPQSQPKIIRTREQWQQLLTPEQYRITRQQGTERPFCGHFHDHKKSGYYTCICCQLPLFSSSSKFDSGTGWPSFLAPLAPENIDVRRDTSHGMERWEILCTRCDAHLGHVFPDGPAPSHLRYCVNSESLHFIPSEKPPQPLSTDFRKLIPPSLQP